MNQNLHLFGHQLRTVEKGICSPSKVTLIIDLS